MEAYLNFWSIMFIWLGKIFIILFLPLAFIAVIVMMIFLILGIVAVIKANFSENIL